MLPRYRNVRHTVKFLALRRRCGKSSYADWCCKEVIFLELKSGYTTGTCAAIGTRAAIRMIFEKRKICREGITTPSGVYIDTEIHDASFDGESAVCAVKKYSGDDPDVTNGVMIFVSVTLCGGGISIDGGEGVGRVTKAGLDQKIGEAAINTVPRRMMTENASELFEFYGYGGGAKIIISVPGGRELAKKTFNPRLGIEGGISILGTGGTVEPMSERAIVETIKTELSVKRANEGDYAVIAPGNYGMDFIRDGLNIELDKAVKCSNYVGEALDSAVELGFKGVLLIGHIGKLIKLSGGIMNTHSKNADCRAELLSSAAASVCEDITLIRRILACTNTEEAVSLLKQRGICDKAIKYAADRADYYMRLRTGSRLSTGIVMFSSVYGILGMGGDAERLIKEVKK